ncbi:MAG: hypothetical protein LW884_03380 [Bacteroidetes bacterium]|jgi:putative membrane protein|nr:hypothetical protein [Bacteroidota bacterium]
MPTQLNKMIRKPLDVALNEERNWFFFVRRIPLTRLFRQMAPSMLVIGAYTFGIIYLQNAYIQFQFTISPTVHSLLGITLGLLLVIRTNTAYDRFWEGRKLAGALVNASRNLAMKLSALVPQASVQERQQVAALISSFAYCLKEHLRYGTSLEELTDLSEQQRAALQQRSHRPNQLAHWLYQEVWKLRAVHLLETDQMLILDKQLEQLTDITGGCERILHTPLPAAYKLHLKIFIFLYIITLPFSLMNDLIYFTVPIIMIVFYAMVGLEMIAEEIENPFGADEHDIPMDEICADIRTDVQEILLPQPGPTDDPQPEKPGT